MVDGKYEESLRGGEGTRVDVEVSLELGRTRHDPFVRGAVHAEDRIVDEPHGGSGAGQGVAEVHFVRIRIPGREVRVAHGDLETVRDRRLGPGEEHGRRARLWAS